MIAPETALHISIANFLTVALPPEIVWTTFPAGGGGKERGRILKAMGLKAGFPDLLFVREPARLYVIEAKTKDGVLSKEQKDMHRDLRAAGVEVAVCRSVEDVELQLRAWDFPLRATTFPNARRNAA